MPSLASARPFRGGATALAIAALVASHADRLATAADGPAPPPPPDRPLVSDLLIVGGTESGCAAAVQAARMGVASIVLVNDIEWLGGQFSAEALGAIDENRARSGTNETPFPRSGLFAELLTRIERHNLATYGAARPGNTVVQSTVRASDAARHFRELLAPYVQRGQVRIVSHHYPIASMMTADKKRLTGLRFAPVAGNGPGFEVQAKLTIDASDWGEAIRVAGAEFEFGPDLKQKYGEPSAPTDRNAYPVTDMNPITWCLVIEETDREEPIPRPEGYDERCYFVTTNLTTEDWARVGWKHRRVFQPGWPDPEVIFRGRRLVDAHGPAKKADRDAILLNFPPQNYPLDRLPQRVVAALEALAPGASKKNIVEMTRAERQVVFDDAKRHALGFLHHLQTTVHDRMSAAQRKHSFRRFALTDEFGTPDRLPPKPYIRESLRLKGAYVMREQDGLRTGKEDRYAAAMYHDGVGAWQFEYDFHPTGRAFVPELGPAGPWECFGRRGRGWGPYSDRAVFPLRSLVPVRVEGLLGAQKNLGYSSLVSSAVRLHDQSMMVGQAAGATAAVCLKHGIDPRAVPFDRTKLDEVRRGLGARLDSGVPVALWPFRDLAPEHPAFEAANLLAAAGRLGLARTDIDFRPDAPAEPEWVARVVQASRATKDPAPGAWPEIDATGLTRGEFARKWEAALRGVPDRAYVRQSGTDADGDGIADVDDALPLSQGTTSW